MTEAIDSPLYRVGAGLELDGVNGVGLAVRYDDAFGQNGQAECGQRVSEGQLLADAGGG
ncbi:hypothetical protein LB523_22095 [Mesorhizobium sp. ESP-6-4]|uniref:hypothetical protein n=1 Tax=Mesorhizobium sp. ESP-6-4 TaxID=2876624 RepID=UPI001CCFB78E|nr:hypothetical protein [Mesorhizobium sp. ESP-6-4]MBZ9661745.1 hypothetical protein [Mesorhizobium sp. ESP-6-4]